MLFKPKYSATFWFSNIFYLFIFCFNLLMTLGKGPNDIPALISSVLLFIFLILNTVDFFTCSYILSLQIDDRMIMRRLFLKPIIVQLDSNVEMDGNGTVRLGKVVFLSPNLNNWDQLKTYFVDAERAGLLKVVREEAPETSKVKNWLFIGISLIVILAIPVVLFIVAPYLLPKGYDGYVLPVSYFIILFGSMLMYVKIRNKKTKQPK